MRKSTEIESSADKNPEGQPSTINILFLPIDKVHWDIKSIIYILFKPAPTRKEVIISGIVN